MKQEFFKKKLENGMTVLFEKRNLPVTSISFTAKTGAIVENKQEKGISHFVEHLLFKGTKNRSSEQIAKDIEKRGGIINGFTDETITSYWVKIPAKHSEIGIKILSDIITNPLFCKEEIERERKVILEEIKLYHDNPMYYVKDRIKELLYNPPFGLPIIGSTENIMNISREDIIRYFNSRYKTENLIMCVVGNADFKKICEFAENNFSKQKFIASKIRITKKIPSEVVETRKGLDQAHFVIGYHSPTFQQKEKYAYAIFLTHIAGGMSSTLFREIREKRGLAYAITPGMESTKQYGYSSIYVGTSKDKIREVKEIILKEFAKIKKMSKRDLEETKEQIIGVRDIEREDSMKVMENLIMAESSGRAEEYYEIEENISSVKLEEIKKIRIKSFSSISLIPG